MKRPMILDSHALLVFFQNEPGADKVEEFLYTASVTNRPLMMTVINWSEVYYANYRARGKSVAEQKAKEIAQLTIEIVNVDLSLTKLAAELKATKKMSYADCFAAALTKLRKGELITGDKEFKEVEDEIKIVWLS